MADEAESPKWDYSFSLWPCRWTNGIGDEVLKMMNGRKEVTWTEAEFSEAKSDLAHFGFSLREVERRPHAAWTTVPVTFETISEEMQHDPRTSPQGDLT